MPIKIKMLLVSTLYSYLAIFSNIFVEMTGWDDVNSRDKSPELDKTSVKRLKPAFIKRLSHSTQCLAHGFFNGFLLQDLKLDTLIND